MTAFKAKFQQKNAFVTLEQNIEGSLTCWGQHNILQAGIYIVG